MMFLQCLWNIRSSLDSCCSADLVCFAEVCNKGARNCAASIEPCLLRPRLLQTISVNLEEESFSPAASTFT